jgi:glycosyltransferase involved in cell wall biosynthesis
MISICCPSRGRPELAMRLINTVYNTVSDKSKVEFLFYLNEDDPTLEQYKQSLDSKHYIVGPDQSTCFSWNQLAERSQGDIVMLAGDDIQFQTPNWDLEIEKTFNMFEDRICMVVPWDGNGKGKGVEHKHKTVPVIVGDEPIGAPHFFVHKNWINTLGYFAPPFFWHWYVDSYTQTVSRKLKRCILLPYVIVQAKKVFDDTATKVRQHLNINKRDDYVWSKIQGRYLEADIKELKTFIEKFNLKKD